MLIGGADTDYASYETSTLTVGVVVNANNTALSTGDAQGDSYSGIEGIRGSKYDDTLLASTTIAYLDGGKGNDTMTGTTGNNTFVVDSQGDVIVEAAAGGTDTVLTAVDGYVLTAANVENLTGSGSLGLKLTGSTMANTVTGTIGNDTLDGGADALADTLVGGKGDDTYLVHSTNDVVTELGSEGTDTVIVDVTGYTLGANVEVLKIADSIANITTTSSASGTTLIGNGLVNYLASGAAADTIIGIDGGKDIASYQASTAGVSVNLEPARTPAVMLPATN